MAATEIEPIRPVRRRVLSDEVYEELLGRLTTGAIAPQASLNIDGLARELDVSHTPIREALARLEATGLIRRSALKGYRVSPLFTEAEIVALMDARLVIEPWLAQAAAARVDADFLREIGASLVELRAVGTGATHDVIRYRHADERFHNLIAEQAGNAFLLGAFRTLGGQVQRFRLFGTLGSDDSSFAAKEHQAIADALESGDAEKARGAMEKHISSARERARRDRTAITE